VLHGLEGREARAEIAAQHGVDGAVGGGKKQLGIRPEVCDIGDNAEGVKEKISRGGEDDATRAPATTAPTLRQTRRDSLIACMPAAPPIRTHHTVGSNIRTRLF
jgi:hypothetical protein